MTEPATPTSSSTSGKKFFLIMASSVLIAFILGSASAYFTLNFIKPPVQPAPATAKPQQTLPTPPPTPPAADTSGDPAPKKKPEVEEINKLPADASTPLPIEPEILSASANEAQEIIDLLRSGYLESPKLIDKDLKPSNLNDFLAKAGHKAKIATTPYIIPSGKGEILSELLPHNIGYWRLAAFEPNLTDNFTLSWRAWKQQELTGLIIDLRYFKDANNFEGAKQVASLFCTPGIDLFSLQGIKLPQKNYRSDKQPLDITPSFPILVLINDATRGAGEVLAFCLKKNASALLVGSQSAGEAGLFTETKLSSGRFLRLATATALTPNGTSLLGKPLKPDIPILTHPLVDAQAWQAAIAQGIPALIAEAPVTPRNVDGSEDPPASTSKTASTPSLKDVVLQHASDIIRGIVINRAPPTLEIGDIRS